MKTSPAGVLFISKWEGFVGHTYNDQASIPTIGYGHRIRPGDGFGPGSTVTQEQALALLAQDVATAENGVNAAVKVPLTQNQFDALVDFAYNCGTGALQKSTILAELNAGNAAGAAAHFTDWCHAVEGGKLVVDQGLLRRRQSEAHLFLTPDAPPSAPSAPLFPPPFPP